VAWAKRAGHRSDAIITSPDGQKFFFITLHGDLQQDRTISTIYVYDRSSIIAALTASHSKHLEGNPPHPLVQTRFASSREGKPGIVDAKWDAEGEYVSFRGIVDNQYEVIRISARDGRISHITNVFDWREHGQWNGDGGVDWFDSKRGTTLFSAHESNNIPIKIREPFEPVIWDYRDATAANRRAKLFSERTSLTEFECHLKMEGHPRSFKIGPCIDGAISPDGKLSAVYSDSGGGQKLSVYRISSGGRLDALWTIPVVSRGGLNPRILWTHNARSLVLIGLGQPLAEQHPASSVAQASGGVSVLDVNSGAIGGFLQLADAKVVSYAWDSRVNQLSVTYGHSDSEGQSFRLRNGHWRTVAHQKSRPSELEKRLKVFVRQNINVPPNVVARYAEKEALITPPDPVVSRAEFLPFATFRWQDPYDGVKEGAIVLPKGWRKGTPVPLIIQPYAYIPAIFAPDGPSRTSDAAQVLAARGFAVAIIDTVELAERRAGRKDGVPPDGSTPTEGPEVIRRIDAVVDALVEQKIASPDKIGIIGFSRGGYETNYVITHPRRTRFAAVVIGSAVTLDYSSYLEALGSGFSSPGAFRAINHAPWDDEKYWAERDVLMNVDRVQTPAMFIETVHDDSSDNSPESLRVIGAYLNNQKPIEYLYVPNAFHELARPSQIYAVRSSVADWMTFWLSDAEVDDQFNSRWKKLRDDWVNTLESTISKGEQGFIQTRSGMAYKITERKVGSAPKPGDRVTVRYSNVGAEKASLLGPSRQITITIGPDTLGHGDMAADRGGQKGLDECVRLMHPRERAICIYPDERVIGDNEVPAKLVGGSVASADSVPHRYEVELIGIASPPNVAGSF
jgi:hypothetical protein